MSTAPAAGAMDQRITFQRRAAGQNALGEADGDWQDVASCWAQAQPLRGREFFAAGQMQQATDVRFRIRYRTDITHEMRVVWKGLPHELAGPPIDVDGGGHTLELMCIQGVRDGR